MMTVEMMKGMKAKKTGMAAAAYLRRALGDSPKDFLAPKYCLKRRHCTDSGCQPREGHQGELWLNFLLIRERNKDNNKSIYKVMFFAYFARV